MDALFKAGDNVKLNLHCDSSICNISDQTAHYRALRIVSRFYAARTFLGLWVYLKMDSSFTVYAAISSARYEKSYIFCVLYFYFSVQTMVGAQKYSCN